MKDVTVPEPETIEHCTHPIWEPCRLHPIDCPNCQNEPTCGIKETMLAHPDKIKRCKAYRRKRAGQTPLTLPQESPETPREHAMQSLSDTWGPLHRDSGESQT